MGKSMCAEATEKYQSTIQILSNFCHIDHRWQFRHLFFSQAYSPRLHHAHAFIDDSDSHFIKIMVKAIL